MTKEKASLQIASAVQLIDMTSHSSHRNANLRIKNNRFNNSFYLYFLILYSIFQLSQEMTDRDARYMEMTTRPVRGLVTSMAVPSILSMIVSSLYNIIDTYFVGRLDTQSTAALGVVFSYMAIMQAVSFFFGIGSGNFMSRALGARKDREAEVMASTGFISAVGVGCVIAVLCMVFSRPVLTFFGSTPTVLPRAIPYFRYVLIGTPFIVGTFVLNNHMRFQGNASYAVYGIMSGAVLNVLLDPVFIFFLKMGVAGAGLATAISQAAAFLLMLRLCRMNGGIAIRLRDFRPARAIYAEICAGGLPSLARQGLLCVSTIMLNNFAGMYGDFALAAFSIVGRIMHLTFSVLLGFGQGFQPVCGYNFGARLYDRLRKAFRFSVTVETCYCLVIFATGLMLAPQIIGIFRDDPEVVSLGAKVLRAQCLTYPLLGFITMSNMYLQNIRETMKALVLAVARNGLFIIPALLVGVHVAGLDGLVCAQPVADMLSFLLSLPLCVSSLRNMGR